MPNVVQDLKAWRVARDLTHEAAAALVVIDGVPCNKSTWHAWETGRKIPSRDAMAVLRDLTGLSADIFYPRPRTETPKAPVPQPLLV